MPAKIKDHSITNPCHKESQLVSRCMNENNYGAPENRNAFGLVKNDSDACARVMENYKRCKKFWGEIKKERMQNGISPALPPPEEREEIRNVKLTEQQQQREQQEEQQRQRLQQWQQRQRQQQQKSKSDNGEGERPDNWPQHNDDDDDDNNDDNNNNNDDNNNNPPPMIKQMRNAYTIWRSSDNPKAERCPRHMGEGTPRALQTTLLYSWTSEPKWTLAQLTYSNDAMLSIFIERNGHVYQLRYVNRAIVCVSNFIFFRFN